MLLFFLLDYCGPVSMVITHIFMLYTHDRYSFKKAFYLDHLGFLISCLVASYIFW